MNIICPANTQIYNKVLDTQKKHEDKNVKVLAE